jgi:hypothetical protein
MIEKKEMFQFHRASQDTIGIKIICLVWLLSTFKEWNHYLVPCIFRLIVCWQNSKLLQMRCCLCFHHESLPSRLVHVSQNCHVFDLDEPNETKKKSTFPRAPRAFSRASSMVLLKPSLSTFRPISSAISCQ